jgi:hypothetical protein
MSVEISRIFPFLWNPNVDYIVHKRLPLAAEPNVFSPESHRRSL